MSVCCELYETPSHLAPCRNIVSQKTRTTEPQLGPPFLVADNIPSSWWRLGEHRRRNPLQNHMPWQINFALWFPSPRAFLRSPGSQDSRKRKTSMRMILNSITIGSLHKTMSCFMILLQRVESRWVWSGNKTLVEILLQKGSRKLLSTMEPGHTKPVSFYVQTFTDQRCRVNGVPLQKSERVPLTQTQSQVQEVTCNVQPITSATSTGSRKGQASSCFITLFSNFWHKTSLAPNLGSFLPAVFLLGSDRSTGDEDREESIELRPRPRDVILILPLRLVFGAGDGERDDGERDDDDRRRRFVDLSALVPVFRVRGGGDGEDEDCLFRDRLVVFFVCLLFWREVLPVGFFLTVLMLRSRFFWAAGSYIVTYLVLCIVTYLVLCTIAYLVDRKSVV